jgi:hypothetical protein
MRKIVLTGILLGAAVFSCQLNAQVKKAPAKPKTAVAAVKGPVLSKIDFFNLAPDDAVQILHDELRKIDIKLKDINEDLTYAYVSGKKTDVRYTVRRLDFDNQFSANITSNAKDLITEVSFSINDASIKHAKNIKRMLGYSSWPAISVTDIDTIYRSGDMIASSLGYTSKNDAGKITGQSLNLFVKKIAPYTYVPKNPKQFDPKNLSVHDYDQELGYEIVDFMKNLGINLLYKDRETTSADEDDGLEGYGCIYYFDKSVWVSLGTNKERDPDDIYIQCYDPITFSKLKKALGVLQWPESKGHDNESGADYYEYKNIISAVHSSSKSISFSISPLEEDVSTRLKYTKTPTFNELVELYKSGKPDEVAQLIASNYVTMVEYDKTNKLVPNSSADKLTFFFITPNNKTARGVFMYNDPKFQKGTEIYVGSSDLLYMKDLMSQYIKSTSDYNHQMNLNGTRVKYPSEFDQIWFLNKQVYDQEVAKTQAEKQQQEAELARIKERDRLEAIEKEKERAARSAETLNKLSDFLKNYGKKQ